MKVKKIITMIVVLSLGCIMLVGCSTYGVDNSRWKTMSPKERQIAMKHYYRQQAREQRQQPAINRINAKNAPVNNAISAITGAIDSAASSGSKKHKKCITDNFDQTVCGYNCYVDQFGQGHCASS